MPEGKLKFFNVQRGYGFLITDQGDVMLHISDFTGETNICRKCRDKMIGEMAQGTPIRYEHAVASDKGLRASSWAAI